MKLFKYLFTLFSILFFSLGYHFEEEVTKDDAECPERSLPQVTEQMILPDPLPQVL